MIRYNVSSAIIKDPKTPLQHLVKLLRMLEDFVKREKVDEKTPCPMFIVSEVEKSEIYISLLRSEIKLRSNDN